MTLHDIAIFLESKKKKGEEVPDYVLQILLTLVKN